MKNIFIYLGIILLALSLQMCSEENPPVKPGRVQFSFKPDAASNGRVTELFPWVPDSMMVLYVTIQDGAGEDVYFREEVSILRMGDRFVTTPLALEEGDYEITEFMLAYRGYDIWYATPMEGSPLASLVSDPLPIAFSVTGNVVTDTDVEVLDVRAHETAYFGYVTFDIVDVPFPQFQLAIFKHTDGGIVLSGGHVYVLQNEDTVFHEYLPAGVNDILLPDVNLDVHYTLIIEEEGYERYEFVFMIGYIEYVTEGKPFAVTLEPETE